MLISIPLKYAMYNVHCIKYEKLFGKWPKHHNVIMHHFLLFRITPIRVLIFVEKQNC